MISGHGNIESAVRAIKMGAFDFIEKPLSLGENRLVVATPLRQPALEGETGSSRDRRPRLRWWGRATRSASCWSRSRCGADERRVLIHGETGPARSLVRGRFTTPAGGKGPFIEVKLRRHSGELIESELLRP